MEGCRGSTCIFFDDEQIRRWPLSHANLRNFVELVRSSSKFFEITKPKIYVIQSDPVLMRSNCFQRPTPALNPSPPLSIDETSYVLSSSRQLLKIRAEPVRFAFIAEVSLLLVACVYIYLLLLASSTACWYSVFFDWQGWFPRVYS